MATVSTPMRPLAPAKPTTTTSSSIKDEKIVAKKGVIKNQHVIARKLAPALPKLAPSQGQRPLKPLLAAAPTSTKTTVKPNLAITSSIQRPILAAATPITATKQQQQQQSSSRITITPSASSSKTITPVPSKIIPQAVQPKENIDEDLDCESPFSTEFSERDESQSPIGFSSVSGGVNNQGNTTTIIPKKEWILPARAKPGRKPSEVEPPTRRKAQNRASQRAFRERRQSYVNSLESKISQYEKDGIKIQFELQKISRKLKEENDLLKEKNNELQERIKELERSLLLSSSNEAENQQQQHESGMSVSMLLEDAPKRKSWDWSGTSNDFPSNALTENDDVQMGRDCGFCTEQSFCLCSGEAVLDFNSTTTQNDLKRSPQKSTLPSTKTTSSGGVASIPLRRRLQDRKPKLWYTLPINTQRPIQVCPTVNSRRMASNIYSNPHLPTMTRRNTDMLPPIHSSLFNSRPKNSLWPVYPLTSPSSAPHQQSQFYTNLPNNKSTAPTIGSPTVFRMRKTLSSGASQICSGNPKDCSACSTDPALAAFCKAVSSHLDGDKEQISGNAVILDAGNALPLRKTRRQSLISNPFNRTQQHSSIPSTTLPLTPRSLYTNGTDVGVGVKAEFSSRPHARPRLWSVSYNGYQPLHHNGKQEDYFPKMNGYGQTIQSQQPLQAIEGGEGIESIPEAWQRIKQHPSFAQWQGGLDLLADVVTRKSSSDQESNNADEEEDVKSKKRNQMDLDDDETKLTEFIPSPSKQSTSNERNPSASIMSDSNSTTAHKRRRLFVDRKRVDDVLALMDKGTPILQNGENNNDHDDNGQACACPLSKIL